MYNNYFGFRDNPFSIAPDPRYLFLSEMHQDALAHLRFGAASRGGIILLTGEVGTGKTTLSRFFLEQLQPTAHIALIINPGLSASDLLATVCDEFRIPINSDEGTKDHIDALNDFLLSAHAENREALLIIDEAQNLDKEALEMVRLLTNLETNQRKLLKIFLLGQSELASLLKSPDLTQISQRITGRFHLTGLGKEETGDYIDHRINVAGGTSENLFTRSAIKRIHRLTGGIPRLINALCDRSLLGAYSEDRDQVDEAIVKTAARELFGFDRVAKTIQVPVNSLAATMVALILIIGFWVGTTSDLFHLKLDTILPPPEPSVQESNVVESAGKLPSTPAVDIEEVTVVKDAETLPAEPEPEITVPEPTSSQVRPEDQPAIEPVPTETPQIPEPGFVNDSVDNKEDIASNIFIAPVQISSERKQTPNTKIVIKHIEIND